MRTLSGTTRNVRWTVEVKPTADNLRYFAVVTVGGKVLRTDVTYRTEIAAQDGGCYLLAKTLAEVG